MHGTHSSWTALLKIRRLSSYPLDKLNPLWLLRSLALLNCSAQDKQGGGSKQHKGAHPSLQIRGCSACTGLPRRDIICCCSKPARASRAGSSKRQLTSFQNACQCAFVPLPLLLVLARGRAGRSGGPWGPGPLPPPAPAAALHASLRPQPCAEMFSRAAPMDLALAAATLSKTSHYIKRPAPALQHLWNGPLPELGVCPTWKAHQGPPSSQT